MKRAPTLILACLLLTACAGNGGEATTTTAPAVDGGQSTSSPPAVADTTLPEQGASGGVDGVGHVTVDLGDRSYEFITTLSMSGRSVSSCNLHEREDSPDYPYTDYFEVSGYAISSPEEAVQLGVTPEVSVRLWSSSEEANAYIDEFWHVPIDLYFSVEDEGEGLSWGAYDFGDAFDLSQLTEDPSWADAYPGLGTWTVESNRIAGQIYVTSGGDFDELLLATFEIVCPG